MNEFYYVVREERPHIDAPKIIRFRYLREDGSLEANFEAASNFKSAAEARRAAADHMRRIKTDNPPAPSGTVVKVIACNFVMDFVIYTGDAPYYTTKGK